MQMPEGIKAMDVSCRGILSIVRVGPFFDISIGNSIHQFVIAGIVQSLDDLEIAVDFVT